MRPQHEPTEQSRSEVERLASIGAPIRMIAACLGMSEPTLRKYYDDAIQKGHGKCGAKIQEMLYDKCMSGDSASIFFYLKTQWGYKETQVQETVSVSKLSDDELDAKIASLLEKTNV